MRLLSMNLVLAACCIALSCKKHSNPTPNQLLQHKWQITSLNGEALRYVGKPTDYFNFENGTLYEYINGNYDTLIYQFANDTLTIAAPGAFSASVLKVTTLTSSQLVFTGTNNLPLNLILDSLHR